MKYLAIIVGAASLGAVAFLFSRPPDLLPPPAAPLVPAAGRAQVEETWIPEPATIGSAATREAKAAAEEKAAPEAKAPEPAVRPVKRAKKPARSAKRGQAGVERELTEMVREARARRDAAGKGDGISGTARVVQEKSEEEIDDYGFEFE